MRRAVNHVTEVIKKCSDIENEIKWNEIWISIHKMEWNMNINTYQLMMFDNALLCRIMWWWSNVDWRVLFLKLTIHHTLGENFKFLVWFKLWMHWWENTLGWQNYVLPFLLDSSQKWKFCKLESNIGQRPSWYE